DNTDSVLEAGLGFAGDLKKPGGVIGKEAGLAKKAAGALTRELGRSLVKEPGARMVHAGVGRGDGGGGWCVRGASCGIKVGGAVGLAMIEAGEPVTQAYLDDGRWEVEIAGKMYPAVASLKPLYDPEMKRIKI